MGVGSAFRAVLQLLNTRNCETVLPLSGEQSAKDLGDNLVQFAGAVGFIDADQPIFPISEAFATNFAKTYYRVSSVLLGALI